MFERILLDSGQYILPDSTIELNINKFKLLVESCLATQSKYDPIVKRVTLQVTGREYIFSDNFQIDGEVWGVPEWISDITPLRIAGVPSYYFKEKYQHGNVHEKDIYPFEYYKPKLYSGSSSTLDATLVYNHKLDSVIDDADNIVDWEAKYITINNDAFLTLLTGKFLIALGRSRKAFTMSDIPIQDDAGDMVADGKELVEQANTMFIEEEMAMRLSW